MGDNSRSGAASTGMTTGCWDVAVPYLRHLIPQLTKEEETFSFAATQDFPVKNLQPATVTLYDYYETGELSLQPQSRHCSR